MKITASNTQLIQPKVSPINNNNVAEGVLKLDDKNTPSFSERLSSGLDQVANSQNEAAKLAKNFELGAENDLARVMVGQQVSSLAFQLTLNVRNKALSAYKDVMNMPV
jgi:flagellar hook-basal body complex protein FliE